jgi:HSP20 family molecular chaperone IbpA
VPLPDGVKAEDIKATFADGVLEVSVPMPPKAVAKPQTVKIEEPTKAVKPAA